MPILSTVSVNAGIHIEICSQRLFTYRLIPRPSNIFRYQALELPLTPEGFSDLKSFEETSGFFSLHTSPQKIMIIQMYLPTIRYYSLLKRKKVLEYKISSLRGGMEKSPTEWISRAQICHSQSAGKSDCRGTSATSFLHKWLLWGFFASLLCCCASDTRRIAVYTDLMLLMTLFSYESKNFQNKKRLSFFDRQLYVPNKITFNLCFCSERNSLCNRKRNG